MSKPNEAANYGIVGSVTATAVAVGAHSKAVVHQNAAPSRHEFDAAIDALRAQIAALQLAEPSRQLLQDDVAKIEQMASEKPEHKAAASDILKSLVDKFKMIGVFVQTAVGLEEPIKKLAEWFSIAAPF
jgi:hypothetical protein